jgi:hypothetical protein
MRKIKCVCVFSAFFTTISLAAGFFILIQSFDRPRDGFCDVIVNLQPGDVVFRHACQLGFEGIVLKRLDSRYASGRCRDSLRRKRTGADDRFAAQARAG